MTKDVTIVSCKQVDVTSGGIKDLRLVLTMLNEVPQQFTKAEFGASHWQVIEGKPEVPWKRGEDGKPDTPGKPAIPKRLRLYSYMNGTEDSPIPFPARLDVEAQAQMIEQWLSEVEYPRGTGTDGHEDKGWRATNGRWGRGGSSNWGCFVEIWPAWIVYGK